MKDSYKHKIRVIGRSKGQNIFFRYVYSVINVKGRDDKNHLFVK